MGKIRVLVVDDSIVIRRLLSDSLDSDPQIEVCGTAANGRIGLAKIQQLKPDIVTLDIEMPEMNGIETLVEIRKLYPTLPVIMFSTLTERGAEATFDALAKGASDYVTKPANVGSVTAAKEKVRSDLVPRIKAFCGRKPTPAPAATTRAIAARPSAATIQPALGSTKRIDAVVIASSTGGPNALQEVIPNLPANLPVPVLIVQHMPPVFTKHLALRLDRLSKLSVHEAAEGDVIQPGGVWLAPGGYHMQLRRNSTKLQVTLDEGPPENSCRPAADVLFRSAAQVYGENILSVVLTGMGRDGLRGCRAISQAGGQVLAQDEASCVVWGMPAAVTGAGLANSILPLDQIAWKISSHVSQSHRVQRETATCP